MSTTSLFAEILIVGLEALFWVLLLVAAGCDVSLDILKEWEEYSALITILLLASAYVLGIFVDRVADSFYSLFRYSIKVPPTVPVGRMRLLIMKDSEGMAKFLDYQRSRLRIARATVFNLFVTILVSSIWIVRHHEELGSVGVVPVWILMMGIGMIALILTVFATRRIDKAQIERLNDAYKIIEGGRDISRPVVAAVCYRPRNGEIEFLLVRTKGGKRWTFPKGHVERDPPEMPWVAAKREAGEEAGVSGSIETVPFTHYTYYKGAHTHEVVVAAYLMTVESKRKPDESYREPQWFTPELAMKKLAERRHEKYIHEHHRVIREALASLNRKINIESGT